MYGLNSEIYDMILEIINKYPSVQFKLFGSRAKGNHRFNSDIDIAIIGQLREEEKFDIRNEFDLLDMPYKVDLVFADEVSKQELLKAISEEGIDF